MNKVELNLRAADLLIELHVILMQLHGDDEDGVIEAAVDGLREFIDPNAAEE